MDPELLRRRDQLLERFALMQGRLGGLYYEMAIRDHVRHDVLARKAAELQRVDAELAHVERLLAEGVALTAPGEGTAPLPAEDTPLPLGPGVGASAPLGPDDRQDTALMPQVSP